jgi:hypothetical protein
MLAALLLAACDKGGIVFYDSGGAGDGCPALSDEALAPGEGGELTLTFAPMDDTQHSGAVSLSTNDPAAPEVVIYLSGSALPDSDGDGYEAAEVGGGDRDDFNPAIHPGADDAPYDGVDSDCDGGSDFDADGDGYEDPAAGGDEADCDDGDAEIRPGADELRDLMDQGCDGRVDEDFLGVGDVIISELMANPQAVSDSTSYYATSPGAARLFYGADLTGSSYTEADASVTVQGDDIDGMGQAVMLTDLDGDGLDDLVAGAPSDSTSEGALYFFTAP